MHTVSPNVEPGSHLTVTACHPGGMLFRSFMPRQLAIDLSPAAADCRSTGAQADVARATATESMDAWQRLAKRHSIDILPRR
jgi:hypothetical protein